MFALFVLFCMLLVSACGACFGYAILQPFSTATVGTKPKTRLYICDFFTLSVLTVIPIAFVSQMFRNAFRRDMLIVQIVAGILISVFIYIWWRGATGLSRIGVVDAGKRSVMLGILMPLAIIGSALVVPGWIIATFSLGRFGGAGLLTWLATMIAIVRVAIVGRRVTRWVLAPAKTINDRESNDEASV